MSGITNYYTGTELQSVFESPAPQTPKMATPINIADLFLFLKT